MVYRRGKPQVNMEILIIGLYVSVFLGAAVAITIGSGIGLHFERKFGKFAVDLIPSLLLASIGISALVSNRNVSNYGIANAAIGVGSAGISYWVLRATTAIVIGVSVVVIAAHFVTRDKSQKTGSVLFFSFMAYFLGTYIVSGIFGTEPAISHTTFYPLLVVAALYLTSDRQSLMLTRHSRDLLFGFVALSLVLLIVYPQIVRQDGYNAILPGISFRFWGLASHANNMGPLSLFLLLLLVLRPYASRLLTGVAMVMAIVSVLLAQSKTTWIAAIIIFLVLIIRFGFNNLRAPEKYHDISIAKILTLSFFIVLVTAVFLAMMAGWSDALSEFFGRPLNDAGTLFTGRDKIWSITLRHWLDNPIFGYGPEIWGEVFGRKWGYSGIASNAHNQILDVLGTAGVFGLVFFIGYFLVLIRYAILLSPVTKGVSIGFVVFIFVRGISEVPLKLENITTSDFVMHLIVIGIFMQLASRQKNKVPDKHESFTCASIPSIT